MPSRRSQGRRGRTPIHPAFAFAMELCGPPGLDVRADFPLTQEPQRADLLLIRRRRADDGRARIFRRLWAHLPRRVVAELKTVSRGPRRGDWLRLLGYTVQYDVKALSRVKHRHELGMLLITPSLTSLLEEEARRMGWSLVPLGGGYYRVEGAPYASYLALIDEVALAERDPVLGLFAHPAVSAALGAVPSDVRLKLMAYFERMEVEAMDEEELKEMNRRVMSRYPLSMRLEGATSEEILAHLTLEERLAGLAPEERLAGLGPEERLAGLGPEERRAGLSDEESVLLLADSVLKALPDRIVEGLPPAVREEVRRRQRG